MTSARIWHSSRDPYHCAFRLIRLVVASPDQALEVERARVLDLLLLYPPLLHRASMTDAVRKAFRPLHIPKPEQSFVQIPSAAAAFQDLRVYQNSAITQMVARGLLDRGALKESLLKFSAIPSEIRSSAEARNSRDVGLVNFLTIGMGELPTRGKGNLYGRIGLPARSFAS